MEGEARAISDEEAERMRRSPRSERERGGRVINERSEGVASVSKLTPKRSAVAVFLSFRVVASSYLYRKLGDEFFLITVLPI